MKILHKSKDKLVILKETDLIQIVSKDAIIKYMFKYEKDKDESFSIGKSISLLNGVTNITDIMTTSIYADSIVNFLIEEIKEVLFN